MIFGYPDYFEVCGKLSFSNNDSSLVTSDDGIVFDLYAMMVPFNFRHVSVALYCGFDYGVLQDIPRDRGIKTNYTHSILRDRLDMAKWQPFLGHDIHVEIKLEDAKDQRILTIHDTFLPSDKQMDIGPCWSVHTLDGWNIDDLTIEWCDRRKNTFVEFWWVSSSHICYNEWGQVLARQTQNNGVFVAKKYDTLKPLSEWVDDNEDVGWHSSATTLTLAMKDRQD